MTAQQKQSVKFKKAQAALCFDPELCTGCGSCELMCALFREGVGGPAPARCRVGRDAFNAEHTFDVCRQCLAPSCYVACPFQNKAQKIDPDSRVRYIDEEECVGCRKCNKACPFDPPEVRFNPEKKKSMKCDLCRDRAEGPVCVEYCPTKALKLVSLKKEDRK
ncbi:MAG: 4Fe-4S dicluster domain-containing protein [Deltaproteobacteria bacterium]|nr:4Fe-4S dicluster domain-containing protein [Deltaproteobacteria bacterium]